jgi:hypothetical protein
MRQLLLTSACLAALAIPIAAAQASPGGGVALEICRLPGALSEYSGKAIELPAGMIFATDDSDEAIGSDFDASSKDPPLKVVTSAPVSLGASKFCVDAPIKPLAPAAVQRALGRMFVATGGTLGRGDTATLDAIYGVLQASSN